MTELNRIALVYPYFRTRAPTEMLFAPLGVAALRAQLQEMGVEARIFDCTFSTFEQIQTALMDYKPAIVGLYCMISLSRNAFRIAEQVRKNMPECLLAVGGPLPSLYPDRFLGGFDLVFRGEAEESFPQFCLDYLGSRNMGKTRLTSLPLEKYPGLFTRRGEVQVDNPVTHYSEKKYDTFPLPDRRDFDHVSYQQAGLERDGRRTTSIILTFGCPYDCDFCSRPVFGSRFRRRRLEKVLEEIGQIRKLGYDHLWIADDSFTLDQAYLQEFCQRMAGQGLTWSCLSRVTGLDREIVHTMKAGGCRRVYLGLESGSEATLRLMNKKATVEAGRQAVQLFHEAGIETAAFFIVGYPGETEESIESTFRLALELPLDEISFNVPFPLPGSKLFERVSGLDRQKDWDQENEVTFVYTSEFDEAWLRGCIEETMGEFEKKKGNRE